MSQEAQAWAKDIRTGDPVTKAVLIELCNWAKPTGIVDFLPVARLADVVEVSRRTVQRHLDRLENELLLIRRGSGGAMTAGVERTVSSFVDTSRPCRMPPVSK